MGMKTPGAWILVWVLVSASGSLLWAKVGENTKIYTAFTSGGVQHFESEVLKPLTNEELLRKLRSKCNGVDFAAGSFPHKIDHIVENFDGVLTFGRLRRYSIALTGLPTIVVYNFPEFLHIPYGFLLSKGKVLIACVDRANTCSASVSSSMFEDLVEKIKLIQVLKRVRESTILAVTDGPLTDFFERGDIHNVYDGDIRQKKDREEIFLNAVEKSLGVKVTKIGIQEVSSNDEIQNIWLDEDHEKAEQIAKMWIAEAKGVKDTIESEVVKAAKVYLALEILMEKYNATAIAFHLRSLIKNPRPEDRIWPSLGDSELQKRGIVACCQAHLNVVLTHMLAQYAFGRPSMMGDITYEPFNDVSIVMHCGAPWNPHGDDRRVPYVIRDHAERSVTGHSKPGVGACSEVLFPANEPVTIWRIDVLSKKILVHTGTTVSGYSLYKDFGYLMCRSKLVAKVDAKKIQRHVYEDRFGVHRTVTFGDHRERIKDLATLMGYEVIEEDR
jgi:hypothetical protein